MHNTVLAFGKNIKEKNVIWLFLQIYLFIYLFGGKRGSLQN